MGIRSVEQVAERWKISMRYLGACEGFILMEVPVFHSEKTAA